VYADEYVDKRAVGLNPGTDIACRREVAADGDQPREARGNPGAQSATAHCRAALRPAPGRDAAQRLRDVSSHVEESRGGAHRPREHVPRARGRRLRRPRRAPRIQRNSQTQGDPSGAPAPLRRVLHARRRNDRGWHNRGARREHHALLGLPASHIGALRRLRNSRDLARGEAHRGDRSGLGIQRATFSLDPRSKHDAPRCAISNPASSSRSAHRSISSSAHIQCATNRNVLSECEMNTDCARPGTCE
jgi:hypothetical protein